MDWSTLLAETVAAGLASIARPLVASATGRFRLGRRRGHGEIRLDLAGRAQELVARCRAAGVSEDALGLLETFLTSADAEVLTRETLVAELVGRGAEHDAALMGRTTAFLSVINLTPNDVDKAAPILCDCLKRCASDVKNGLDPALVQEYVDAARRAQTAGLLESLRPAAETLSRLSPAAIAERIDYLERYRRQVRDRHRTITPPLGAVRNRIPLNDLYVEPLLVEVGQVHSPIDLRQSGDLTLQDLSASLYRTVVLGDPGAGKSTLAQKLVVEANSSGDCVGILVVLREYAVAKQKGLSIVEFVEQQANGRYQAGTVPPDAFEYALSTGRALVIFDGLDELLTPWLRNEVSEDVASFAHRFPQTPVLATSRVVGYAEAPLQPDVFRIAALTDFDDGRVTAFAGKWFGLQHDISPDERERLIAAFLAESESEVPDLRTNPLLLTMLCSLYREERQLPRQRAEIYEACATLLHVKWDVRREIPLPFRQEAMRPILADLAHWIHEDASLGAGVTEAQLLERTTDFLLPRRYETWEDARAAAQSFVDFCTGRAWVFTDKGSTSRGELLYQFTHRTFLEFFAGAYLAALHKTTADLWDALEDRVASGRADLVPELALQIKARTDHDVADQAMDSLLASMDRADSPEHLYAFGCRLTQALVPSPSHLRRFAQWTVRLALRASSRPVRSVLNDDLWRLPNLEPVHQLDQVADECRDVITDEIRKTLARHEEPGADSAARLNLLLTLAEWDSHGITHPLPAWLHDALANHQDPVESIRNNYRFDAALALTAVQRGHVSVVELLEAHGADQLFRALAGIRNSESATWVPSLAESALRALRGGPFSEAVAGQVLDFLSSQAPPWFSDTPPARTEPSLDPHGEVLCGPEVLGLCLLLSTAILEWLPNNHATILRGIVPGWSTLIAAWQRGTLDADTEAILQSSNLRPALKDLLRRWAAGSLRATGPR